MQQNISPLRLKIEKISAKLGLGMRGKLISLFVVIKVLPLIFIAVVAWRQSWHLGKELSQSTKELTTKANQALSKTGRIAVNDALKALDSRAQEDIERITTDIAYSVADFLYARDDDINFAATLHPDEASYRRFIEGKSGRIVIPGKWELAPDKKSWQPAEKEKNANDISSSIEENARSFHYRQPENYVYERRPLFLEMTFVDLNGQERVKVTSTNNLEGINSTLKDVSNRLNTFVKAENYFQELKKLKPGEIYVSDVIGEYVGSKIIGRYIPEMADKAGIPFEPENSAYAGKENPAGKRFSGLVRWATPVVQQGKITGYVTLALNHDHLMEFTAHIMPTNDRYTEIPDAYEGNYAFIWDHLGRSIVHPRHYSITGYDAKTGNPQVPWLEDRIYNEWRASGKNYIDFIEDVPTFVEQSNKKKGAPELVKEGLIGLDCRYLNFAPQCTGWFDLTKEGGSGSFATLWSGLWKLSTAATIPYYTGQYAASPRGFGFVAVGAGFDDFHRTATDTGKVIDNLISATDQDLAQANQRTQKSITDNLWDNGVTLSISTGIMIVLVILVAIWLASAFTRSIKGLIGGISRFRAGERQFRFDAPIKDELGALADSFDDMADSLVASVNGALIITDLNTKIIYANETGLDLIHKTLPEIVGHTYNEISLFSEHLQSCALNCLLEGGDPEIYYNSTDNKYYQSAASVFENKEGKAIGYIITISDVTSMANEQKRLEEQRALLDSVFTFSPDLISYKDIHRKYIIVNPRFASVIGREPTDLVGCSGEIFPQKMFRIRRENEEKAISTKKQCWFEESIDFADGHSEIVDTVINPLFDVNGAYVGILAVSRDVSRRVNTENTLLQTQIELKKAVYTANKASESKSAFLARMSHEIRTPMNAIIGMANIARRKLDEVPPSIQEIKTHIDQVEVSSQHLLGLLNDILDLSKIEAGKIQLGQEIFDLRKLVENVDAIIRPRCIEKRISFTITLDGLDHCWFSSDALRLRQVLINLLGNAVKFTADFGIVDLTVTQKDRSPGKTLLNFAISDSGIGIPEEAIATVFLAFEQGNGQISQQYGGTGLGLAISKNIVSLMSGELTVQSTAGEGSTFSFEVWFEETEAELEEGLAIEYGSASFEGKRILLVDDIDINRMIVIEQLSESELVIDEAENGQEAVEKFAASPEGYYDLIFMDVQMPVMDGYQAATAIRALERKDAKSVAIFAMTANAFKEDVEKAMAHGMTGHLSKPLEYEKLMQTLIKSLLNK